MFNHFDEHLAQTIFDLRLLQILEYLNGDKFGLGELLEPIIQSLQRILDAITEGVL